MVPDITYKTNNKQVALFVAPHPDDELLIGGGMLARLIAQASFDVFVYVATNGDYLPGQGGIRVAETINGMRSLGVETDHILFGGFGDNCPGKHLYDAEPNDTCSSRAGQTKTYIPRFAWKTPPIFISNGRPYTRSNYKSVLIGLLETLRPQYVFCVAQDDHPDHRALNLICEECICELVKTDANYRPILLEKKAYEGVYAGEKDYFRTPHRLTQSGNKLLFYSEKEATSYTVPSNCDTIFLHQNVLYKAATKYKSQRLRQRAAGIINRDIVYWLRYTDNLALFAKISVSSGDGRYINDFKLLERSNVREENAFIGWRPEGFDKNRTISIRFNEKTIVHLIKIYVIDSKSQNKIRVIADRLDISNTEIHKAGILPILLKNDIECNMIQIQFEKDVCIGEIEVFNSVPLPPFMDCLMSHASTEPQKAHRFHGALSHFYNFCVGQFERTINIIRRKKYAFLEKRLSHKR